MADLRLNISEETLVSEEKELLNSFTDIDVELDRGRIRLGEGDLSMIISFSVGAITSGIFWDLIKAAVQRLREKEDVEISRKIIQEIIYKSKTILVTKNSITIKWSSITFKSIDQAINEIDKNT